MKCIYLSVIACFFGGVVSTIAMEKTSSIKKQLPENVLLITCEKGDPQNGCQIKEIQVPYDQALLFVRVKSCSVDTSDDEMSPKVYLPYATSDQLQVVLNYIKSLYFSKTYQNKSYSEIAAMSFEDRRLSAESYCARIRWAPESLNVNFDNALDVSRVAISLGFPERKVHAIHQLAAMLTGMESYGLLLKNDTTYIQKTYQACHFIARDIANTILPVWVKRKGAEDPNAAVEPHKQSTINTHVITESIRVKLTHANYHVSVSGEVTLTIPDVLLFDIRWNVSPDGKMVGFVREDLHEVQIVDAAEGEIILSYKYVGDIRSLPWFLPEKRLMLSFSDIAKIINIQGEEIINIPIAHKKVEKNAVSPTGNIAALYSSDIDGYQYITIIDLKSGRCDQTIKHNVKKDRTAFIAGMKLLSDSKLVIEKRYTGEQETILRLPADTLEQRIMIHLLAWYKKEAQKTNSVIQEAMLGSYERAYPWIAKTLASYTKPEDADLVRKAFAYGGEYQFDSDGQ